MHSVTSNAVYKAIAKTHYYHTTFTGVSNNGWSAIEINFDKEYKYPPIISVTLKDIVISQQSIQYWQDCLNPFYNVTTKKAIIAYYVKDSHQFTYDVNVIGELADNS